VSFGPVTPELKKGVHPSSISSLVYVRLTASLLDATAISTEFCEAISRPSQFWFTYSLGGVTAVLCELHARLCHAFLVTFYWVCNAQTPVVRFVVECATNRQHLAMSLKILWIW